MIAPNPPTGRDVGAFKPYLQTRIEQEPETGNQLPFPEIRARGYRGSLRTLREYLAQIRRLAPAAPPAPGQRRSARRTAHCLNRDHNDRLDRDNAHPRRGVEATAAVLDDLVTGQRRRPERIRMDNGPELLARALLDWFRCTVGDTPTSSRSSPGQNRVCESFNGRSATSS